MQKIRKEDIVFLLLTGLFFGSLTMLNILGTSRFIDLSFSLFSMQVPFVLAIGVLPYPITFLCTDLISEFYGKKKASLVVWIGLILNIWVIFIVWAGGILDAPDILINGELPIQYSNGEINIPHGYEFYHIRKLTLAATAASMIAYLSAQFIDVELFHYLKEKSNGKKLWLRNNGSTLVSQLVDSIAVILITHFFADGLPKNNVGEIIQPLYIFIFSSYVFKMIAALIDTIPFYIGVNVLNRYFSSNNSNAS